MFGCFDARRNDLLEEAPDRILQQGPFANAPNANEVCHLCQGLRPKRSASTSASSRKVHPAEFQLLQASAGFKLVKCGVIAGDEGTAGFTDRTNCSHGAFGSHMTMRFC